MKRAAVLRLAVIALAASSLPAAGNGYEIVQEVKLSKPQPTEMLMTMRMQGDFMRMDMGGDSTTIINTKTGDVTNLMHAQKLQVAIPGGVVRGVAQQAAQDDGTPTDLKPTGRTETINGYRCEEYTGTSSGEPVTMWMTKDIPFAREMMASMQAMSDDLAPMAGKMDEALAELGFPIRIETETPENGKIVVTTMSVREGDFPASDFQVPSGYRSMELPPGMEQMLQGLGVD